MFILAVLAAFFIRVYLIVRDSIPFAADMGRDLLWTKEIAFYHEPTLLGPAASIWGVYYGPVWYYILALPLLITNGNPLSAVYTTLLINLLTATVFFLFLKRVSSTLFAYLALVILLFSTLSINISLFAFPSNILPTLSLSMLISIYLSITKNVKYLAIAFFSIALMFHAEPATAIVSTFTLVFVFFFYRLFKSENFIKYLPVYFVSFSLPFLPHLLFELRNNFLQTQSLIKYFVGSNPSLSGQLPLQQRLVNRISIFFDFLKEGFAGGYIYSTAILLVLLILGLYSFTKVNKNKNLALLVKISTIILALNFFTFTFLFTPEVKSWYLYDLLPIISLQIAASAIVLKRKKILLLTFIAAYVAINAMPYFKQERITISKNDPAQLANQQRVVDLIYEDAKGQNFSVYVFTPSIYDSNYQYLFWYKAIRQKYGLPAEFSYLPDKPEYVVNKSRYYKSSKADNVYLIIEAVQGNEFYTQSAWLKNFDNTTLFWRKNINKAIILEKRTY